MNKWLALLLIGFVLGISSCEAYTHYSNTEKCKAVLQSSLEPVLKAELVKEVCRYAR